MSGTITLAADVDADPAVIIRALNSSHGQRAFWTADADVSAGRARFGFPQAPMDLEADVMIQADKGVRMTVTSGFPFWEGSTWEWELSPTTRTGSGTSVVFRHYDFQDSYPDADLGYTAQTWALILDRLGKYLATGESQPLFPAATG